MYKTHTHIRYNQIIPINCCALKCIQSCMTEYTLSIAFPAFPITMATICGKRYNLGQIHLIVVVKVNSLKI